MVAVCVYCREVYNDRLYAEFSEKIPTMSIYDDHEVYNNFDRAEAELSGAFPNSMQVRIRLQCTCMPSGSLFRGLSHYSHEDAAKPGVVGVCIEHQSDAAGSGLPLFHLSLR